MRAAVAHTLWTKLWPKLSLALLCMGWAAAPAHSQVESWPQPLQHPAKRQIRFNLTLHNPTGNTLGRQTVWLYGPVRRNATQESEALSVSMPHRLEQDALGNQIIRLDFAQFPPHGSKTVQIRADVLLSDNHSPSPSPIADSRAKLFLQAERFIEADDPAVAALAAELKAGTPSATAERIYRWVKDNLRYGGYIADDLGASDALRHRRGDCSEYAYLAAALARANQLPARVLSGYVMARSGAPAAGEFHQWAEVYFDGAWRLLDAQKGNFQTNAGHYLATRIQSQQIPNPLNGMHRFRVEGELVLQIN